MSNHVKLLTFDLDDTLWPVMPSILRAEKALHSWIQQHFPQVYDRYDIQGFRQVNAEVKAQNPHLAHKLTDIRKKGLEHILCASGVDPELVGEAADTALAVFMSERNKVDFFPGALEALVQLRNKGYKLMAISNGNADLNEVGLGELFCAAFSAQDFDRPKPDPAMFLAAMQAAGVQPNEVVHIGDDPLQDVTAARGVGFGAVWVNLQGKAWPNDLPVPTHEVSALPDLPAAVHAMDQSVA